MDTMKLVQLLFSFDGRINRQKMCFAAAGVGFNFVIIALSIMWVSYGLLSIGRITDFRDMSDPQQAQVGFAIILVCVIFLAFLWVFLALMVKRWHDRAKSGWFVTVLLGAAAVGLALGATRTRPLFIIGLLIVLGVLIWNFIELMCLKGTDGANQFGADPLTSAQGAARSDSGAPTHYNGRDYDRTGSSAHHELRTADVFGPGPRLRPRAQTESGTRMESRLCFSGFNSEGHRVNFSIRLADLSRGEIEFGRSPSGTNGVYVDDPTVSSQHARLRMDKQGLWLRDLNSTNKTYVDGTRVGPGSQVVQIYSGSKVVLGGVDLTLTVDAPPTERK